MLHTCSHSSHMTFCRQILGHLAFRLSEIKLSMGGNASSTDKMKYRREKSRVLVMSNMHKLDCEVAYCKSSIFHVYWSLDDILLRLSWLCVWCGKTKMHRKWYDLTNIPICSVVAFHLRKGRVINHFIIMWCLIIKVVHFLLMLFLESKS